MTTTHQSSANGIQAVLGKDLRAHGFSRRGRTYNRTVENGEGIVHVINLQLGMTLSGRCTVNLGVYLPEVALAIFGVADQPTVVHEYDCEIRARIGHLLPGRQDFWWQLDEPNATTAAEVAHAVSTCGLPFLNALGNRKSIIEQWRAQAIADFLPPRASVSLAVVLHRTGDLLSSTSMLNDLAHNPDHVLGRLARIAARRLGVQIPPTPSAA